MMPVKLTEDMVVARSKGSDLHNIKKLNCWGSELSDVSVIRKLTNVEVLSLSVNQITTLADFQWCKNLQELYIRKNNVKDINELLYLRQLPKLKSLWLADNPCAQFENYRLTVLRTLPHLQKLDNVAVEGEEVQRAMVCGVLLPQGGADADRGSDGRSSESGGGGSLSDYSPPASTRAQRHQNGYSSPERDYPTPQQPQPQPRRSTAVYSNEDEDEDQSSAVSPTRRMTGTGQAAGRHSIAYETSSYYQQQQQQQQNNNSSGDERVSQSLPPSRRTSYQQQQQTTSQQRQYYAQSPTRRSSQGSSTPAGEYEGTAPLHQGGGGTPDYQTGDVRNSNYLSGSQEQQSRRVSREQYRDGGWINEASCHAATTATTSSSSSPPPQRRVEQPGYSTQQQQPSPRLPTTPQTPRQAAGTTSQRDASQPRLYTRQQYAAAVMQQQQRQRAADGGMMPGPAQQHPYDAPYRAQEGPLLRPSAEPVSRPYPSRPKTRNGNVLSAVLCLIKELDYTSLEVAEMAIRCRMDELDD